VLEVEPRHHLRDLIRCGVGARRILRRERRGEAQGEGGANENAGSADGHAFPQAGSEGREEIVRQVFGMLNLRLDELWCCVSVHEPDDLPPGPKSEWNGKGRMNGLKRQDLSLD
jgi:hypothetical protein